MPGISAAAAHGFIGEKAFIFRWDFFP